MNCQSPQVSFAVIFWGAIRLAIAIPMLWLGLTHCEMVTDTYEFITETLPYLFSLAFAR